MRLQILKLEIENSAGKRIFEGLEFGPQNLVVGLNTSGKSSVLRAIQTLAALVAGTIKPSDMQARRIHRIRWFASFETDGGSKSYELEITEDQVTLERMHVNSDLLLDRNQDGTGSIALAKQPEEQTPDKQRFETPTSSLALVNRQDSINHPFLIPIARWGEQMVSQKGEDQMGHYEVVLAGGPPVKPAAVRIRNDTPIHVLLQKGLLSEYEPQFKKTIIEDMEALGFFIEDFGLKAVPEMWRWLQPTINFGASNNVANMNPPVPIIPYVKEKGLIGATEHFMLSEGMFRAFAIVCRLDSFLFSPNERPSAMVIDDVDVGLDFERACALIKLLLRRTKEMDIQLIMSSNNRFVMNAVPLQNWTVLRRTDSNVKAFNYSNSKTLFDEFRFTGLNNFDLLATDFLSSGLGTQ